MKPERSGVSFRLGAVGLAGLLLACGPGDSSVGGKKDAGSDINDLPPVNNPPACTKFTFYQDLDGDTFGNSAVSESACQPTAGFVLSGGDCDDSDPEVYPLAVEVVDGKDNDCDGKIDFGARGVDYDGDGYPGVDLDGNVVDCNDENPLVGPGAVEVVGDGTDNDCNGEVDEPTDCGTVTGTTALDFARAIGLCGDLVTSATFVQGNAQARKVRSRFGDHWLPETSGGQLIQLSSGVAVDNLENPGYSPQQGTGFSTSGFSHPLWSASECFPQSSAPAARDVTELRLVLKVPQNANSFSYRVNFFSAEYPEYVCTQYNDRFVALLRSTALDPTKLPGGATRNCNGEFCNISFDSLGQPLSINSGFFDVCKTDTGNPDIPYSCGKDPALLSKTGYDRPGSPTEYASGSGPLGGATGWLTTVAPVKPGEEVELRFYIFDEGDSILDSAVLIDGFKWDAEKVDAPTTVPIG